MCARKKLIIQLESDLCPSSGDGFSGGIDTDVRYDSSGLPYVPGRTIKGCLREAARYVYGKDASAANEIARLFGTRGNAKSGAIVVHRAQICDAMGTPAVAPQNADPQSVLDVFTYERASTALVPGEGYAQDNSLRYMRVIKQYDPLSTYDETNRRLGSPEEAKKLKLIALIEAPENCDVLEKSVKALRAMGMNRNRGLGAVSCTLESWDAPDNDPKQEWSEGSDALEYRIRLGSPLMLAQTKGTSSVEYVPGSSVLGFFASRLKKDSDFDDLFLSGKVSFSPLYPAGADNERCKPASALVVKAKSTRNDVKDGTYWSAIKVGNQNKDGLTYKPCKSGFVDSNWHPVEVKTETVYHHSTGRAQAGDEAMLYTQKCLCEGQELVGYIEAKGHPELLKKLVHVLRNAGREGLAFGRSKSAQYARCSLACDKNVTPREPIKVTEGSNYAFLLDSDVVLVNDEGRVSATYESLKAAIIKALGEDYAGIFVSSDAEAAGDDTSLTNLSYRTITGYNAKWNHKKPHLRAIEAGSVVVFKAMRDGSLPGELVIGSRLSEGFGRVLVVDLKTIGNESENGLLQAAERQGTQQQEPQHNEALAKLLAVEATKEAMRSLAIQWAKQHKAYFSSARLNAAFVGRLGRMIDESENWGDLQARIKSIKADSKKEDSKKLIEGFWNSGTVEEQRTALSSSLTNKATWDVERECLALIPTVGKYLCKQGDQGKAQGQ